MTRNATGNITWRKWGKAVFIWPAEELRLVTSKSASSENAEYQFQNLSASLECPPVLLESHAKFQKYNRNQSVFFYFSKLSKLRLPFIYVFLPEALSLSHMTYPWNSLPFKGLSAINLILGFRLTLWLTTGQLFWKAMMLTSMLNVNIQSSGRRAVPWSIQFVKPTFCLNASLYKGTLSPYLSLSFLL